MMPLEFGFNFSVGPIDQVLVWSSNIDFKVLMFYMYSIKCFYKINYYLFNALSTKLAPTVQVLLGSRLDGVVCNRFKSSTVGYYNLTNPAESRLS